MNALNWSGKIPCFIDILKVSVMTGANSNAKVLRILLGIISGPGDLVAFGASDLKKLAQYGQVVLQYSSTGFKMRR